MRTIFFIQLISFLATPPQDTLAVALQRVFQQYTIARSEKNVGTLVTLDTKLRRLVIEPFERERRLVDERYFKPEYDSLGLGIGHYSNALEYSGKLLVIAHHIDPHSPYRSYTLYSTVNTEGNPSLGPNIIAAKTYLREFPSGPYVFEVSKTLAYFYDDLFKTLRDKIAGRQSYYHDYDSFITSAPLKQQMTSAKEIGLKYYRMALRIRPRAHGLRKSLKALEDGSTEGWYFIND